MMKLADLILLPATAAALRAPALAARDDEARVGLYFGTVRESYTPIVAGIIGNVTGLLATNVDHTDLNFDFSQFDSIIVGSPTYCTGCVDHRMDDPGNADQT